MKKFILFALIFLLTSALNAQSITNTLGSGGNFSITDGTNTFFYLSRNTGLLGIGPNVTNPRAQLEVGGTEGLLVTGVVNSGTARQLGAGVRFHWYPRRGAIRAGMAETTYWDDSGTSVSNMALYSVGMGYQVRPTGTASVALGAYNKATGDYALSLGSYSYATGIHAIAIGTQVYASGIYSIALGSGADTNGRDGSFVFGDDTYFQTAYASADNQITMRFSGGFRFWTSYPDSVSGVYMRHGQSGWSNYCDRNKKENFVPVDGEEILSKISRIPITEWNYKKTDPNEKYVGPMAQDFYSAFHLNGTDSLGINSISIDGINMAAIQALQKRTAHINADIARIKEENDLKLSAINDQLAQLKEENKKLSAENLKLKETVAEINKIKEEMALIRSSVNIESSGIKTANVKNETSFPPSSGRKGD